MLLFGCKVAFNSRLMLIVCFRQYAEFVIAFTQFIKSAVFFIAPLLNEIFVHDEKNGREWHVIFFIIAASLIIVSLSTQTVV